MVGLGEGGSRLADEARQHEQCRNEADGTHVNIECKNEFLNRSTEEKGIGGGREPLFSGDVFIIIFWGECNK